MKVWVPLLTVPSYSYARLRSTAAFSQPWLRRYCSKVTSSGFTRIKRPPLPPPSVLPPSLVSLSERVRYKSGLESALKCEGSAVDCRCQGPVECDGCRADTAGGVEVGSSGLSVGSGGRAQRRGAQQAPDPQYGAQALRGAWRHVRHDGGDS